jgi:hypothetical protein
VSVVIGWFNSLVTRSFDLVLRPFGALDPLWGLAAVSIATGVLMLWIFGKVSNQEAIRAVRNRIRGNLIGIRLFGDDLGILFRLQGRILRQTVVYLGHSLLPILVMIIPVVIILAQMNLRFSDRPLAPGETAVAKVTLREGYGSPLRHEIGLTGSDGVAVETAGVRIEPLREVAWRISATRPGTHRLTVQVGEEKIEKQVVVGRGWSAVPALRTGRGFLEALLYPGERPIAPGSVVEAFEVRYASLPLKIAGFEVHWLVFFFLVSIGAGLIASRFLGIEI